MITILELKAKWDRVEEAIVVVNETNSTVIRRGLAMFDLQERTDELSQITAEELDDESLNYHKSRSKSAKALADHFLIAAANRAPEQS